MMRSIDDVMAVIAVSTMVFVGCSSSAVEEAGEIESQLAAPGSITLEQWFGVTGTAVSAIPTSSPPSATSSLTSFELPTDARDNYGVRVRGTLIAPSTGNYTFWIASDDAAELYLGTSADPATKRRIAFNTTWTSSRQWNKFASQRSAVISLVAGQSYYIEALMKEGTGGDNLAVGWLKPGQSGSAPSEVIPGAQLAPYEAPPATVTYQAETATLSNAVVETQHAGFTGSGYANPAGAGSFVEWRIPTPTAGNARVAIRYANLGPAARVAALRLNGTVINPSLSFPATGGWSTWSTVTVNLTLVAGNNDLRLTSIDSVGAPNLDKIDVTPGGTSQTDTDGDRLPDAVETNTGVFRGTNDTGTSPTRADTDGDGMSDGDETLGTTAGLNLPALGTNPLRKNILIEHDWFEDAVECAAHSHRPTPATIATITQTFANAPVPNPDGSTGITLINDYGQGGVFTGGNRVPDADAVLPGGVDGEFQTHKAAHFASNRQGYFHYNLHVHRYNVNSGSVGVAELPGDDLVVSLFCAHDVPGYQPNSILHELGHNLNLHHGGFEGTNDKPSYNSVMNYRYTLSGIDQNCDAIPDGPGDYSRGTYITLNESSLNEAAGVCGNVSIDWNGSGTIQSNVSLDLNGDMSLGVLSDYDDWANLSYSLPGAFSALSQPVVTCDIPIPLP